MAFMDPFVGIVPAKKMTTEELLRAIRLDLAGEHEAISTYLSHADACEDEFVAEMLRDIANEERLHTFELSRLLEYLDPTEKDMRDKGIKEVNDKADEMKKNLESSPE